MADVLNRTTLEFRRSVNEPDYPQPDWIWNPDMSGVVGVDRKYWVLVGDAPQEMSQAEKAAVDAAEAAARIAELRSDADAALAQNRDSRSLVIRALAWIVLDEINALRTQLGLVPRTKAQMVNAIKAKLAAGDGEA